jgi:catechol 2,3-dioxygenase-like lactoylglutathione lyase family enzyme
VSGDPARPTSSAHVLVVSDLGRSLDYFRDALGFDVAFRWGEPEPFYAGVCRGEVTIHLNHVSNSRHRAGNSTVSIFVGDADAIHRELVERGARIAVPPDDRPYGLRDFSVEDPDGNWIVFGSELENAGS